MHYTRYAKSPYFPQMSNWTFGHLDIWNVQGLGLIYIIIIIIIIINYYFYQNRHLDELKSPKVQKSDLYFENVFCCKYTDFCRYRQVFGKKFSRLSPRGDASRGPCWRREYNLIPDSGISCKSREEGGRVTIRYSPRMRTRGWTKWVPLGAYNMAKITHFPCIYCGSGKIQHSNITTFGKFKV